MNDDSGPDQRVNYFRKKQKRMRIFWLKCARNLFEGPTERLTWFNFDQWVNWRRLDFQLDGAFHIRGKFEKSSRNNHIATLEAWVKMWNYYNDQMSKVILVLPDHSAWKSCAKMRPKMSFLIRIQEFVQRFVVKIHWQRQFREVDNSFGGIPLFYCLKIDHRILTCQ